MSSNLPPGVTEGMIPGNRPEDQVFDTWMEGIIGDTLFLLAKDSLPDISGWVCKWCRLEIEGDDDSWHDPGAYQLASVQRRACRARCVTGSETGP